MKGVQTRGAAVFYRNFLGFKPTFLLLRPRTWFEVDEFTLKKPPYLFLFPRCSSYVGWQQILLYQISIITARRHTL